MKENKKTRTNGPYDAYGPVLVIAAHLTLLVPFGGGWTRWLGGWTRF
jgi:hypothetical protein